MAAHNTTVPFTVEAAPAPTSGASLATTRGASFLSVRATFSANWESLYDQSGVLLVPRRASDAAAPNSKWVKTGIELYDGRPHLSTVTCDRYADWGLYPLTTAADASADRDDRGLPGRGAGGKNAWVHRLVLDDDGNVKERVPLRKICWIFADEDEGDWVLDVGPLAARPDKAAQDVLKVEFSEFTVQWSQ
ncbi:LOW QUALITY PROTEIN: hypothetical protein Ct61P_07354 [Colletotrichum tofieldiae]|nr:LOW QUALITY PROTEIN: hypothetical protein Ct61P_07354 [Colletotrichum tofieldiae]